MNSNETLLLVDDNPDNLVVMTKVLQKALPQVVIVTFQKSAEVMDYVRTADVSVAIFDVQMPVTEGIVRDITERKLAEAELQRQTEELTVSNEDLTRCIFKMFIQGKRNDGNETMD
jgi:CheY-like chemotaxis protein